MAGHITRTGSEYSQRTATHKLVDVFLRDVESQEEQVALLRDMLCDAVVQNAKPEEVLRDLKETYRVFTEEEYDAEIQRVIEHPKDPRAFLTGSRVYGMPREDSDIDIVVLVSGLELALLSSMDDTPPCDKATKYCFNGTSKAGNLRFAKLNMVTLTDPKEFVQWRNATEELKKRMPVTKEQAIECFHEHLGRELAQQGP